MPPFPLLSCSLLLFSLRYFPPYFLFSWHYCLHGLCLLSSFLYSPYFVTIPTIPCSLVLYVCVTCLNACRITFPLCCPLNELFTTSIGFGLLPSSPLLIVGSAYKLRIVILTCMLHSNHSSPSHTGTRLCTGPLSIGSHLSS